ncbi:hypothetical protein [Geodermatophilus obscurus]|nr:hypothetical protein [Geodermatophilus obscurus]
MTAGSPESSGPPPPHPRRPNAVLARLYDAPPYRDPLAWWTLAVVAFSLATFITSTQPSPLPKWLNVVLATLVMTGLFALLPAVARLKVRRLVWRRRQRAREPLRAATGDSKDAASILEQSKLDAAAGSTNPSLTPSTPAQPRVAASTPRAEPRSTSAAERPAPTLATPLADDAIATSPVLRAARALQYPVARAVRGLQAAPTPKDQYEALLDAADALTITVGASAAAWLRFVGDNSDELTVLRTAYERGVTQGSWQRVARRAAKAAADTESAPAGLAMVTRRPRKNERSLLEQLDALTQERNKWAHGSPPRTEVDAAQRLARLLPVLESALTQATFLAEVPWFVTRSSSYLVREQRFDVSVAAAMGDHPEFERRRLSFQEPLADGRFYMLVNGDTPVDLTPFVVLQHCDVCNFHELFYADRLPGGSSTVLKSFGNGHVKTDKTLDEDILLLGNSSAADSPSQT